MAKLIIMDFGPSHSSSYGIEHSNIAESLNESNWKNKAVVRDGHYLIIHRGRIGEKDETKFIYFIEGLPNEQREKFDNLKEAIDFINNFSDKQGQLPEENESIWRITTFNKNEKLKKFEEKFKDMDSQVKLDIIKSYQEEEKKKNKKKYTLFESIYLKDD